MGCVIRASRDLSGEKCMAENTLIPVHYYLLSPLPWCPSYVPSREFQEDNLQCWCLLYLQLSDIRAAPLVCQVM